ncbi:hypothetical protein DPSP01_009406 [Paraphaeosphaeria sporulosa]
MLLAIHTPWGSVYTDTSASEDALGGRDSQSGIYWCWSHVRHPTQRSLPYRRVSYKVYICYTRKHTSATAIGGAIPLFSQKLYDYASPPDIFYLLRGVSFFLTVVPGIFSLRRGERQA